MRSKDSSVRRHRPLFDIRVLNSFPSAHASKTDQHEQVEMSPHRRRLVEVLSARKDWVGLDS